MLTFPGSWNEGLRRVILEKNPTERVVYWMGESLALDAIQRVIKKRGIVRGARRQPKWRQNVPFNQHAETVVSASIIDTLLLAATMRAHIACMRLLLDHGANPCISPTDWLDNLVSVAIFARSIDAVKLLVGAGANIDRVPLQSEREYDQPHANTPLAMAILEEHIPSVELLLECGANPNVSIYDGNFGEIVDDAWEFATRHEDRGRPRLLEVFMRHGMFPDRSRYEHGYHPVLLALRAFNIECAAILVRAGAVREDYEELIQSDTDTRFLWAAEEVRNMLSEWERQEARASRVKGKFGAVGDWIRRIRLKAAKR
ncbi:hypothetical protein BJY00DRAFT_153051 [Aspergillus carlsbadensis]|nr:hypothetical protein BJY00DRAFT_153051 [Aspergillus carlsbadensis]